MNTLTKGSLLFLSFALGSISYTNAADTDYLEELSQEAESTSKVKKTKQLDGESSKKMVRMEQQLETIKPSAFKYYKRLDTNDRLQVFSSYVADESEEKKRISNIRKKIMDLYFK